MEVWGQSTQPLGDSLQGLKKNGYFNAIWITFHTFSEQFKRTKFLRFESQLNKSLPLLLMTWPGPGNQGTLLSGAFLALNHSLEDLPLKILALSRE